MFHFIFIPEVTGSIQHKTTPFKARRVLYLHGRNGESLFRSLHFYSGRQQLVEAGNGGNDTRIISGFNLNRLGGSLKFVRAGLSIILP